ncbi:MAG: pantoate--beta-alanine ligase [Glaciihabitans sp.]|nr:pantoate--beta-alanine ligase [Glaciihabitans sp.]
MTENMIARPVILETVAGARSALSGRNDVVLVPTMGALHAGHVALVERALELGQSVVVSIFVNPLQFGPTEDLDVYPRHLDEDIDKLHALGVPFVFAPSVEEMYPSGTVQTKISAGSVGGMYEGRSRPGLFDGALTVVAKLLNIMHPSTVVFGQKDAQQVFLVRRMIGDLNIPVAVEVVDTVRDENGLALSSRNSFLDGRELHAARALSQALEAASSSADGGIDAVLAAAQGALMGEPLVQLDYLKVVNPDTFLPSDDGARGPAVVLIAARVGNTRLIDNERIVLAG